MTKRDFIKSFVYGFLFLISKPFGLVSNFSDDSEDWEACKTEMSANHPKGYKGPYIVTAEQINKYDKAWLKANAPVHLYNKWWTE